MSKKTIFIAENVEANQILLQEILSEKYDLLLAQTGESALEILKMTKKPISTAIIDTNIANTDAFTLLSKMQDSKFLVDIPVIICGQAENEENEIKALSMGAKDYITKPYKASVILARLANIIAQSEIENQYAPYYDKLTKIYSEQTFYEKTKQLIQERNDTQYIILRWNIERFKLINDIFGKQKGDEILVGIALALRKTCSNGDVTFGRLTSDHFVLCVPYEKMDIGDLITNVDKFLTEFILDYKIVSNFGVYVIDDIHMPVSVMCDRANLALNSCKGNYAYPCAVYDEKMRNQMLTEQSIIADMVSAIKNKEFEVYYQPIVSVDTKRICGAEALVRWHHPKRGFISPAEFIPVFEQNGFISQLDEYVINAVCMQLSRWRKQEKTLLPVAVNLSRLTLYNPRFSDLVIETCAKYNIDSTLLELEITESTYTEDPDVLLKTMEKLQALNFKFSMDDFGSGYSSFNMLKDVPFDVLKIDLNFLENFEGSSRSGTIVSSIVRMAKWLNMPVIVEGVETKTQMEFLRSIGCDKMQGYYFSKPLPLKKFENFMEISLSVPERQVEIVKTIADFDTIFATNETVTKILNTIAAGIGIYEFKNNEELEILKVNDGYYNVLGYNPSALYSDDCKICDDNDKIEKDIQFMQACVMASKTKQPQTISLQKRGENSMIWLSMNIQCLGYSGKNPILCIAFNDITNLVAQTEKQEKIAQKLQEQYQRYKIIAEKTGTIIFEWNMISDKWESDDNFCDFMISQESPAQFFEGAIPAKAVYYLDTPLIMEFFSPENVLKDGLRQVELRLAKKGGEYVWCKLSGNFLKDEQGNTVRAVLTINEIDERVKQHQKAKYQEELYRLVNRSNNEIICDYEVESGTLRYTRNLKDGTSHSYEITNYIEYIPRSSILHESSKGIFVAELDEVLNGGVSKEVEVRMDFTGNNLRWYRIYMEPIIDKAGRISRIVGKANDIQKEKDIVSRLSKDQSYLNALVAESLFAFEYNFKTTKATLVHQTQKYQKEFLPYKDYIGTKNQSTSIHPEDIDMVQKLFNNQTLQQTFNEGEKFVKTRYRIKDRRGNWVWVECSTYILQKENSDALESLVYFKVVDSEKKAHDELVKKAQFDGLSGIYNRATAETMIEEYMAKSGECAAFLLIDIDNFKTINDTCGHLAGDKVIRETGHALKSIFRVNDISGRVGGDEFCVLLKNTKDKDLIRAKAQQISIAVKNMSMRINAKIELSVSIGVYIASPNSSFTDICAKADEALYRAKNGGKDQVKFY